MNPLRTRSLATLAIGAVVATAGAGLAHAAPDSSLLPDDLAFLDNSVIDDLVAGAENGSADCAALENIMGISFITAFINADWGDLYAGDSAPADTEPEITAEAIWAIAAPVLVPVLARADTSDASAQQLVGIIGPQLVGALHEMRDLGLSDDDLLLIQRSWVEDTLDEEILGDDTGDDVTATTLDEAMANLEARAEELVARDFDAITFLDEGSDVTDIESDSLPWEASCPQTMSMLDFGSSVDVSATFDMSVTITLPGDDS